MVYTTYSWWTWGWFIIVLTTLYVILIRGQGDDSPNPILIPYSLLYPHIILNPHTAIPIIPKLPYHNINIYTYIYIYVSPLLYIFTMWAPVYDIAKLGPQLGMARPEGLSLKTRSARMEPVALQQTDAWGRDRFLGPSWLAGVGKLMGLETNRLL